jgi:hypothetical protein
MSKSNTLIVTTILTGIITLACSDRTQTSGIRTGPSSTEAGIEFDSDSGTALSNDFEDLRLVVACTKDSKTIQASVKITIDSGQAIVQLDPREDLKGYSCNGTIWGKEKSDSDKTYDYYSSVDNNLGQKLFVSADSVISTDGLNLNFFRNFGMAAATPKTNDTDVTTMSDIEIEGKDDESLTK